ncbi:MAG: BACON domain-containing protein [Propionibacteriaceae bacterium]|jgi:hypothetical protein|nr:BACON domain-containing protein [Propionibacteriaceae bacterium]
MRKTIAAGVAGLVFLLGLGVPTAAADDAVDTPPADTTTTTDTPTTTDPTPEPPAPTTLKLSRAKYTHNYKADKATVKVTTNAESFTIAADQDWVTLSAASGVSGDRVTINLADNLGDARTATITVTAGDQTATIAVSQGAAPATIIVGSETLEVEWGGATAGVSVETNQPTWAATSNKDWVTVTVDPAATAVTLTVAENTGAARTATVTVKAGNAKETIKVKQAAGPVLKLSKKLWTADNAGETVTIKVTSPYVGWTASVSEGADWLTVSQASGEDGAEVTLTAAENPDTSTVRKATVTFTNGYNSVDVNVTQRQPITFANIAAVVTNLLNQILAVIQSMLSGLTTPAAG